MSEPDPIAEAFNNYRKPPRDVVPRTQPGDQPPIPRGFGIEVVSYEITDTGVTRETENVALVRAPIYNVEQLRRRRLEREEDT